MGKFSEILISIEEQWSDGKPSDEIAEHITREFGIPYTEAEIDMAIEQVLDAQDQWYNDDMDGDFDSAMTSAGFGTDEDYGYYGD